MTSRTWWLLPVSLCALACSQSVPRLLVDTEASLIDEVVDIRVDGLDPDQTFSIEATTWDHRQRQWIAVAAYPANRHGTVSLAEATPVEGSFEGANPMGLFWSGEHVAEPGEAAPDHPGVALLPDQRYRTELRLVINGETVDRAAVERTLKSPDVRRLDIREDGVVGTYFAPGARRIGAAVVVVAGSDGGIASAEWRSVLLASRGFDALALAYFRFDGLPESLLEIPLETLGRAARWLRREAGVARVGLLGFSKGSELSLSTSARIPLFGAVVAYTPSSVVWQGIGPGFPRRSSWSFEGEALDYVPWHITEEMGRNLAAPGPKRYRQLYLDSLDVTENREAVEAARIPVEAIDAPLLLITGTEDGSWPADRMAREILRTRQAAGHQSDVHLSYEGAGHLIFAGSLPTAGNIVTAGQDFGGDKAANARAQIDSWPRVLAFLEQHLAPVH